mmetsp:Transcript_14999/g.21477  ORF Transcript_14999/g.21477 Transcript_14999/m.21477 type:complete len:213 (-) Transcript_14999:1375-2013(-)
MMSFSNFKQWRIVNFLGLYAIQLLTDDVLTPDDDDGDDAEQHNLESQESIFEPNIDIEDHEDDEEEDEEDDFDADDMFDTNAEARRAFKAFAGEDLRMSKSELRNALLHMGVSMITDEEVKWAFRRYDDDYSGWISFEQLLNIHSLFDGSLLWRRKKLKKFKRGIDNWLKDITGLLKNKKKTEMAFRRYDYDQLEYIYREAMNDKQDIIDNQ